MTQKFVKSKKGDIPLVITDVHQEVFPHWYNSGLKDAPLLHIDSHDDLGDDAPTCYSKRSLSKDYYKKLNQANFICPAVYHGIVKDIVWISPFQKGTEVYIQHIPNEKLKVKNECFLDLIWEDHYNKLIHTFPPSFLTKFEHSVARIFGRETQFYIWREIITRGTSGGVSFNPKDGLFGKSLNPEEVGNFLKEKYILDIDLDAFAKEVYYINPLTRKETQLPQFIDGWEERITDVSGILEKLVDPSLITITRSQGDPKYVPTNLVDIVQEKTLDMLDRLYSKR